MKHGRRVTGYLLAASCLLGAAAGNAAEKKLPGLVDFGAHQCIPCKMMAPILEQLTKDYAGVFTVEFIDVWQKENAPKARAYGIGQIPTQVFLDAEGKELWRHVGFLSRKDILKTWRKLGYDFKPAAAAAATADTPVTRWEPQKADTREKDAICYLCDGDVAPGTRVAAETAGGTVTLCGPHHFFVMLSCLLEGAADTEKSARVTDASSGATVPAMSAFYLYDLDTETGRPAIQAFAARAAAEAGRRTAGGSILTYTALKATELESRCGFCDRSVYPRDAARVKVGPGLHTWGCCAHCALGVAARTGQDIEVHERDTLTGEPIVITTRDGAIASLEPGGAIAWFGMKKKPDGTWGSAGCFHQGLFVSVEHLRKWLDLHPYETGKQVPVAQALADKMKLSPAQIRNACKLGACAPR
jgi:thioredoxin 1